MALEYIFVYIFIFQKDRAQNLKYFCRFLYVKYSERFNYDSLQLVMTPEK